MIARRKLLLGCATVALTAGTAQAQQNPPKLSKQDAGYQDAPKDDHLCAGCTQFQPPKACNVVDGEISPHGWCKLFEAPPE
jgi:hypothetical protein